MDDVLVNVYRAVKTSLMGVSNTNQPIFGLTLEPLEEDLDWLSEEIQMAGGDLGVELPDGGLVEGRLYRLQSYNVTVDYETGYIDGYDLRLVEVKAAPSV